MNTEIVLVVQRRQNRAGNAADTNLQTIPVFDNFGNMAANIDRSRVSFSLCQHADCPVAFDGHVESRHRPGRRIGGRRLLLVNFTDEKRRIVEYRRQKVGTDTDRKAFITGRRHLRHDNIKTLCRQVIENRTIVHRHEVDTARCNCIPVSLRGKECRRLTVIVQARKIDIVNTGY